MCIKVSNEHIWTSRVYPSKSTTEVSFQSPLAVLPLVVGGGGGLESDVQLSNGGD
jgi:hypothetical protein